MNTQLDQLPLQINLLKEIFKFSIFTFSKEKDGKYIHANDAKLKFFGFNKVDDLIGLYDTDLMMTNDQAGNLRTNDTRIIKTETNHAFLECVTGVNNKSLIGISYKSPLRLKTNKVAGITGVSFCFPREEFYFENYEPSARSVPQLSKRQNECLRLLACGMTFKQIAKQMGLSPRTIEHYIDTIKNKLNCSSRVELIKIFFSIKNI